jgi:hypothetical protein
VAESRKKKFDQKITKSILKRTNLEERKEGYPRFMTPEEGVFQNPYYGLLGILGL